MREWCSKLRAALRQRHGLDDDLVEELRTHLAFLIEENIARGLPPDEARTIAQRQLGNETSVRERAREAWTFPRIETILQDLRSGFRNLLRFPGFSLIVIVTLALGIGANTAIFSVVDAVLLRPPPYPDGERLVEIFEATSGQLIPVSWINFEHWRREAHTFEDLAAFETADLTLTGHGQAVLTHAGIVSSSFFRLTGWRPAEGRLFNEADDQPGAAPVVLVNSEFAAKMLGGDSRAVRAVLNLDGKAYEVIGVLPPGLRFFTRPVDFYMPIGARDGNTASRAEHGSMAVLVLLR